MKLICFPDACDTLSQQPASYRLRNANDIRRVDKKQAVRPDDHPEAEFGERFELELQIPMNAAR